MSDYLGLSTKEWADRYGNAYALLDLSLGHVVGTLRDAIEAFLKNPGAPQIQWSPAVRKAADDAVRKAADDVAIAACVWASGLGSMERKEDLRRAVVRYEEALAENSLLGTTLHPVGSIVRVRPECLDRRDANRRTLPRGQDLRVQSVRPGGLTLVWSNTGRPGSQDWYYDVDPAWVEPASSVSPAKVEEPIAWGVRGGAKRTYRGGKFIWIADTEEEARGAANELLDDSVEPLYKKPL